MNIQDIIALAKAGYKPADVKELIELSAVVPEPKEEPVQQPMEEPKDEPIDEPIQEPKEEPDKEAEIAELRKQLASAQQANIHQNMIDPNKKTDEDLFADLARAFM